MYAVRVCFPELKFRLYADDQRAALDSIYREVGFARSLLAFELPDGRLKGGGSRYTIMVLY